MLISYRHYESFLFGGINLKFIDFFAGIGGFSLALTKAGHELAGFCEIDDFAVKSYNAIHNIKEGDIWYAKDIKKVKSEEIPVSDIWTAGFPCQDISVCKRGALGLSGARSGLFFEIIRLIKGKSAEDKPDWLILENVKNLLSINQGWDHAAVLTALAEVGYDAEYGLLNSKFHGVPQNRERVYIVARRHYRGQCAGKIFPVRATDGKDLIELIGGRQGQRVYDMNGISSTLTAQGGGFAGRTGLYMTQSFMDLCKNSVLTNISRCLKSRMDSGVSNRKSENSGIMCYCFMAILTPEREKKRQNGRRVKSSGEPMFCLTTQDRHGVIICRCEKCIYDTDSKNYMCCLKIRKLTPREAWRLQAIEDKYFDRAAAICSDAQLYKQAGNGVTVSVVYAIAEKINEIIQNKESEIT